MPGILARKLQRVGRRRVVSGARSLPRLADLGILVGTWKPDWYLGASSVASAGSDVVYVVPLMQREQATPGTVAPLPHGGQGRRRRGHGRARTAGGTGVGGGGGGGGRRNDGGSRAR